MFFTKKYKKLIKENNKLLKNLLSTPETKRNSYRFIELNKTYLKVAKHWFWDEYDKMGWEPQTYNTYKKFLTPETDYIDIGSWIGMTIFYAAELGVKKMYGIEANPLSFKLVQENCMLNKITQNVQLDNICISNIDNKMIGFGGLNGEENTSSASNMRGNCWQVLSKTLSTYLLEKHLSKSSNLFIKIDIEGAEEFILEDLLKLASNQDVVVYLSIHPPFMDNKVKFYDTLTILYSRFKKVYDSNLEYLSLEKLKNMILTEDKYPQWGTKFGNFFEITLTNKE